MTVRIRRDHKLHKKGRKMERDQYVRKEEKRHVIIDFGRGNMIACEGYITDDEDMVMPVRPNTVRNWGTDRGIGQIAALGPTQNTVLDGIPFDVEIPVNAVHEIIIINPDSYKLWAKRGNEARGKILNGVV